MKRGPTTSGGAATLAGCALLAFTSCSTSRTQAPMPPAAPPPAVTARLAQMSFGANASYAVCIEPACPKVTPKTLANGTPAAPPGEPAAPTSVQAQPAASRVSVADPAGLPGSVTAAPSPAVARIATPPTVGVDAIGRSLTVTFPFASAELSPAARTAIRVSLKDARRASRIVIAGRTDDIGNSALNGRLALRRANAVRNFYRGLQADLAAKFAIDAKGTCCYLADNTDPAGRSRNRRVEIVFNTIEEGV